MCEIKHFLKKGCAYGLDWEDCLQKIWYDCVKPGYQKKFLASLEDVQVQNTWRDRVRWHLSYQFRYCVNVCICVSLYARIWGSIHFVLPSVFHRPEYLQNVNVSLTSVWHCQPWTNFVLWMFFIIQSYVTYWCERVCEEMLRCICDCWYLWVALSLSVLWQLTLLVAPQEEHLVCKSRVMRCVGMVIYQ